MMLPARELAKAILDLPDANRFPEGCITVELPIPVFADYGDDTTHVAVRVTFVKVSWTNFKNGLPEFVWVLERNRRTAR